MQHSAHVCASYLVEKGITKEEDREIYVYGLEVLFSVGSFTIVAVLLGQLTGYLPQVLAFLLAFIPLRCCVGGYHATTPGSCLFLSLTMIVATILVERWVRPVMVLIFTIISVILIFRYAPIIHPHHPFSKERRFILRRRARILGALQGIAIVMLQVFQPQLVAVMSLAFLIASLGMPLAVWRRQAVTDYE